jgi:hypothetical protein
MLFYGVYNYAYYVFGTAFSDVFLLHVVTFALSLYTLVVAVTTVDAEAVAARVTRGVTARVVAAVDVVVGTALVAAWGGYSLRFALTGAIPPDDVMPPAAIHLVYALDLSLLAPAFLIGGVLLWRRRPWGAVLGVAVNAFGAAYLTVLEFVGGFEADAGIAGKTWMSLPAIGSVLVCAACLVALVVPRRSR